MIQLQNLTIETRHPIVRNIHYTFQLGKIYGIVSENGSGKTTLFRTMVHLIDPKEGKILFDGKPVESCLKDVFYFEDVEWLDGNLKGEDYIAFVKKMWDSKADIKPVIQALNMEEYIRIPIKKYSLGMKQKLIIGMYLISDATYLIMDEITNGLDDQNRKRFFEILKEWKKRNKTILLSSHYKDEISEFCDIVLQIRGKKLKEVNV
ncbi:MAG: ABC transporter ATP-binding protein [Erysipelotrichaceae bacterium]|nr:ABC transporter ATP-binding protein [Erysipelotrichaceae bacterium]